MPEARISIHALLAESDQQTAYFFMCQSISIHALLAESDWIPLDDGSLFEVFLSTLSLRRATPKGQYKDSALADFYPRSPCGERHLRVLDGSKSSIISIHALLAESDRSK